MTIIAGTPEMIAKMYDKKTYVERLFVFPDLMLLTLEDVYEALSVPGKKAGLSFDKQGRCKSNIRRDRRVSLFCSGLWSNTMQCIKEYRHTLYHNQILCKGAVFILFKTAR